MLVYFSHELACCSHAKYTSPGLVVCIFGRHSKPSRVPINDFRLITISGALFACLKERAQQKRHQAPRSKTPELSSEVDRITIFSLDSCGSEKAAYIFLRA
jgi:hypothetical protein